MEKPSNVFTKINFWGYWYLCQPSLSCSTCWGRQNLAYSSSSELNSNPLPSSRGARKKAKFNPHSTHSIQHTHVYILLLQKFPDHSHPAAVQLECNIPLLFLGTSQPELHAEVSLPLSNFPGCHLILGAGVIKKVNINFHQ
jgi:hypothetical protein